MHFQEIATHLAISYCVDKMSLHDTDHTLTIDTLIINMVVEIFNFHMLKSKSVLLSKMFNEKIFFYNKLLPVFRKKRHNSKSKKCMLTSKREFQNHVFLCNTCINDWLPADGANFIFPFLQICTKFVCIYDDEITSLFVMVSSFEKIFCTFICMKYHDILIFSVS